MYDYISIHYHDYTNKIRTDILENYLTRSLGFTKVSHLRFTKEVIGEVVNLTGIHANLNGSYAFNTLEGIEEVNLIEIDVPRYTNDIIEKTISEIAVQITKEFSWIIDEDHGLN
ncbi:hypothetical protein ACP26L_07715 [Paenibacillus sp. S-38]|uniref:hypothetical protein n=1 Tax=Paenibacillus sp. S-38 TaxID=3416710 RepID=UPI003CF2B7AA